MVEINKSKFIKAFAKRFYKELPLSDFTYAMIKGSKQFMSEFMFFLGFQDFDISKPWNIYREKDNQDFLVEQEDKTYIIENKIGDTEYHFKENAEKFKDAKRAIISAHKLNEDAYKDSEKYKFNIQYWHDFVDSLQKRKYDENLFFDFYIKYIKEVCSIMEVKVVRGIGDLSGLSSFVKLINHVITTFRKDGFECGISDEKRDFGDYCQSCAGQYLKIKSLKSNKETYPLFGIEYDNTKETGICIWFEKDLNELLYSKYKEINQKNRIYTVNMNSEDKFLEFKLNKTEFDEFLKASLDRQKETLKGFLEVVIEDIDQYI